MCPSFAVLSNFLIVMFLILEGLLAVLEASRDNPHPEAYLLPAVFEVKAWIGPATADVHGHVKPHCFKFVRDDAGKAIMFYRKWSHEEWMGPIQMLKVQYNIRVKDIFMHILINASGLRIDNTLIILFCVRVTASLNGS